MGLNFDSQKVQSAPIESQINPRSTSWADLGSNCADGISYKTVGDMQKKPYNLGYRISMNILPLINYSKANFAKDSRIVFEYVQSLATKFQQMSWQATSPWEHLQQCGSLWPSRAAWSHNLQGSLWWRTSPLISLQNISRSIVKKEQNRNRKLQPTQDQLSSHTSHPCLLNSLRKPCPKMSKIESIKRRQVTKTTSQNFLQRL